MSMSGLVNNVQDLAGTKLGRQPISQACCAHWAHSSLVADGGKPVEVMHCQEAQDILQKLEVRLYREADQGGRIRWRSGVTCAVSADKAGIFQKTGVKQCGQIVWRLDTFKAQHELSRHANLPQSRQSITANPACVSLP